MDLVAMGCSMSWVAKCVRKWCAGGMALLLGLGVLSGCQPIFLTREVYEEAHRNLLPPKLEKDHCPITGPVTDATAAPPSVSSPDRPAYYLTLQEAIATALENGHVSGRAGSGRGLSDDSLLTFNAPGSLNGQTERLRVLALNPAISNAAMEASLARYDAVYHSSILWNGTDNVQTGLFSSNNGHGATYTSSIIKPLSTGGIANVSFIGGYNNLNAPPTGAFAVLNPQYTARLSFGLEQPLLRDWGEINQLLPRFPSAFGQGFSAQGFFANGAINSRLGNISSFVDRGSEGILISRLRFDQSRAEFERNVQMLIMNTEVAYWTLYNKYGQLYSVEENLKVMHKSWQEAFNLFKAGSKNMPPEKYNQVLGQFEEFRAERVRALQEVLDAERNLRGIIDKPVEDGTRLVPITPPTLTEFRPKWDDSLQEALTTRPELVLARENLRYHQYLLTLQNNSLKPDLRAFVRYEPVGFGSTLQGNGTFVDGTSTTRTTNTFKSLRSGDFNEYQMGLNLIMPLGYRFEQAATRAARLELAQSYYLLRDQEERAARALAKEYQELAHWYKRIEAHRAERLAYLESLKKHLIQIDAGQKSPGSLEFLETQRRYAAALTKEYNAIAEYNSTLARFEWAKGAGLRYNNIHISEGPLPQCAQIRAVEQQKERSRSLVLRERPDSLYHPGRMCATKESDLLSSGTLQEGMDGKREPIPVLDEKARPEKLPTAPLPLKESRLPDPPSRGPRIDIRPLSLPLKLPIFKTIPNRIAPPNAGPALDLSPSVGAQDALLPVILAPLTPGNSVNEPTGTVPTPFLLSAPAARD